jgi:hypothetical protein
MNKMVNYVANVPDTIEDLSRFVLVGREKALALKAEIRAIEKLGLAEEVRNQKREEVYLLREVLLDAEVRLGELMKGLPKNSGGDRKSEKFNKDSTVPFENEEIKKDSTVPKLDSSKKDTVRELGFSEKQKQRFEALADNKDLVEREKAAARDEGREVSRTKVLEMAAARKKRAVQDMSKNEYIDYCAKVNREMLDVALKLNRVEPDQVYLKALMHFASPITLEAVDIAISKLSIIRQALVGGGIKR